MRTAPARAMRIVLLVALAGAAACGGSGQDFIARATDRRAPSARLDLRVGDVRVSGVDAESRLDPAVVPAVMGAVRRYLRRAVLEPLLTGTPAPRLELVFAPAVANRARIDGLNRAVLSDDGVPVATGKVTTETSPVVLDALVGADGAPVLVAASFGLTVEAETADGPLAIRRTNELTFEPGADGDWLLGAFRIGVQRSGAGIPAAGSAGTTGATGSATGGGRP